MLLNRFKIFLILLLLLFLSILFGQNRELLALRLLCPDVNQSCLYQTPPLPLSLWMFAFILAGVVTSLVWQLLNYLSTKGFSKTKSSASTRYFSESENTPKNSQTETKSTNTQSTKRASVQTNTTVKPRSANNFTPQSDWEDNNRNDDWNTEESTQRKVVPRSINQPIDDNKSYQSSKDSSSSQNSDTTYSYKSPPANNSKEQKVDRVTDANYRVINPSLRKNSSEQIETKQDEDDEEWI